MIFFYNPHVDDFLATPPHFRLLGRRALRKYGFLFAGIVAAGEPIRIYADSTCSAFIPDRLFALLPGFLRRAVTRWEMKSWHRANGLDGRTEIFTRPPDNSATLFMFAYKGATGPLFSSRLAGLSRFKRVIAHLSHYHIRTAEKARNLQKLGNIELAGDSDISANAYFRRFFGWYDRPFALVPFAVAARFHKNLDWADRVPKALATGSFHDLREERPADFYRDLIDFFGLSTYHPLRKAIYEARDSLRDFIECRISPYRGEGKKAGLFTRLVKKFSVSQKSYFSIDIAALYNQHRYAVVGEEVIGFPALGAFEAMASGCLLLAQPQHYEGLAMAPGVHFLTHAGTIDSVRAAIARAEAEPQSAIAIAEAGWLSVEENMREAAAFRRFMALVAGG